MKREDYLAKLALEGELPSDDDYEIDTNDLIPGRGSLA